MKTKIKFIPLLLACMLVISAFGSCGLADSLVGSWEKDDGVLTFVGGDSGTFSYDSLGGMYDDTGSYSISGDGSLTMKINGEGSTETFRHVSSASEVSGETWCVDGDTLYYGLTVYTRKH